jgi:hypothetical protein
MLRSFGLSIRSFHNVLAADPAALDVVHIHVRDFILFSSSIRE